jgi:aldose 1-epimerase
VQHYLNESSYKGYPTYTLQNEHISLTVLPEKGMMISRMDLFSDIIIDMDMERLKKGQTTGIPVLYPTPNRVSGEGFIFEDEKYELIYKNKPLLLHGAASTFDFRVVEKCVTESFVSLTGEFIIEKDTPSYEYFPFESKISITVKLEDSEIYLSYHVSNYSKKNLPYGLGFHPFFKKKGKVLFRINAEQWYEMNKDKYPTGKLLSLKSLPFCINELTGVDRYNFDHVFTNINDFNTTAEIIYADLNTKIRISASEDFGHLVVYTPSGRDSFCIENQTCSSDCHNLYNQGNPTTGLQILAPKEEKSGHVCFHISRSIS